MPYCEQCGGEVAEYDRSCTHCGAERDGLSESPARRGSSALGTGDSRELGFILALLLIFLLLCVVYAPLLAPHDPTEGDLSKRRDGIGPFQTLENPLGVDYLGRDVFSRLIYGARTNVLLILASFGVSAGLGTVLGVVTGFCGGRVDRMLVAVPETFLTLRPAWLRMVISAAVGILVALVVVVTLGTGFASIALAVGVIGFPQVFLAIRDTTRRLRGLRPAAPGEVTSPAVVEGNGSRFWTSFVIALLVLGSLQAASIVIWTSVLSFLIGMPAEMPTWGMMVSDGRSALANMWWPPAFALGCIVVTVAALYLFGRLVRNAWGESMEGVRWGSV